MIDNGQEELMEDAFKSVRFATHLLNQLDYAQVAFNHLF